MSPTRPRENGLTSETLPAPASAIAIRLAPTYHAPRPGPRPATIRRTEELRSSTIAPDVPPAAAPTTSRERPGDSVRPPPAPAGSLMAFLRARRCPRAITRRRSRAVTYVIPLSVIATPVAPLSFTRRSRVFAPRSTIAT